MQNLLTKQEPEGAYNTDLHALQKHCHLNHVFQINTSVYTKLNVCGHLNHIFQINTSVYTKLNVCEDLEFIIQAFSSR